MLIESAPPVSWNQERQEIALAKYGIELRAPAGVTTEAFARYADAYNRVMRPKIISRYGRGVFDAIHREAIALKQTRTSQPDPARPAPPQPPPDGG